MSSLTTLDSDVLTAVARGPRFGTDQDWRVEHRDDDWWVLADSELPQQQVLAAGAAAQEIALAVEAGGRRAFVQFAPQQDPTAVAAVRVLGPGPASRARSLLGADDVGLVPRSLEPAELTHLGLVAAVFGCELLWQDDAGSDRVRPHAQRLHARDLSRPLSTVVTRDDRPEDWFSAGGAVAQCRLVAADLHALVQLGPHALAQRDTREDVRDAWGLAGWPQAQFTVLAHEPDF